MKTNIHLSLYVAHFFIKCKIFRIKLVEKIKIRFLQAVFFFSKIVPFVI